jgi:hypothetical protein
MKNNNKTTRDLFLTMTDDMLDQLGVRPGERGRFREEFPVFCRKETEPKLLYLMRDGQYYSVQELASLSRVASNRVSEAEASLRRRGYVHRLRRTQIPEFPCHAVGCGRRVFFRNVRWSGGLPYCAACFKRRRKAEDEGYPPKVWLLISEEGRAMRNVLEKIVVAAEKMRAAEESGPLERGGD